MTSNLKSDNGKLKKSKKSKKSKKKQPEPEIDYSDFRNNAILKPAPLSNPQENTQNNLDMGLSMAAAAKQSNLKSDEDRKEVKVAEFGTDMKNRNDTITSSEMSFTESNNPKPKNTDIMISFKPINLIKEQPKEDISIDMSFGGQKVMEKLNYASTLIKENDETKDQTKDGQEDFVYEQNRKDELNDGE